MKAAIVFDSRTHTTERVAAFIAEGLKSVNGIEARCFHIDEADFEYIQQSQLVIFGSPTYMASVTAKMKSWLESNAGKLKLAGKIEQTPAGVDTGYTWISLDPAIATVSAKGVVKGVKKGTATIIVTTANGLSANVKVTVK